MKKKKICKKCKKEIVRKMDWFGIHGTNGCLCLACFMAAIDDGTNQKFTHWCPHCRKYSPIDIRETDDNLMIKCARCGKDIFVINLLGP